MTRPCGSAFVLAVIGLVAGPAPRWAAAGGACDCPADLDSSGAVDTLDLGILLSSWSIPPTAPGCAGAVPCASDLNGDGHVNSLDLGTLLSGWGVCQAVLHVPGDFASIQAAINAACDGDEIVVAQGNHFVVQGIEFLGKRLTVRSAVGAALTAIVWNGALFGSSEAVVNFVAGETQATILDGFTIRDGGCCYLFSSAQPVLGGGVRIIGASPTIRNCVIRNNDASLGGGVYCSNGAVPRFVNCVIRDNTAGDVVSGYYCGSHTNPAGAGLYCESSVVQMEQCEIRSNHAGDSAPITCGPFAFSLTPAGSGGGIYLNNSTLTMTGCSIIDNSAGAGTEGFTSMGTFLSPSTTSGGHGGGVSSHHSAMTLNGCTISGNRAGDGGVGIEEGGMACGALPGGSGGNGGGLHIVDPSGPHQLINCIISGNVAGRGGNGGTAHLCFGGGGGNGGSGAGVWMSATSGVLGLSNCTVQNNFCGDGGAGGDSPASGGAAGGNGGSGAGLFVSGSMSACTVTNCTISGNAAGAGGLAGLPPRGPQEGDDGAPGAGGGIRFAGGGPASIARSNVCGNTPDQVAGPFSDLGGTCLAPSCLTCP